MNKNEENTPLIIFMYFFCPLAILYSLYILFFTRNKVFMEVAQNELIFNEKTHIVWENIILTGILSERAGKSTNHFAILGLSNGEILQIDVLGTDIAVEDVIKIIHLKKKKMREQIENQ